MRSDVVQVQAVGLAVGLLYDDASAMFIDYGHQHEFGPAWGQVAEIVCGADHLFASTSSVNSKRCLTPADARHSRSICVLLFE